MSGTLYFNQITETVSPGDPVIIIVGQANSPPGIWNGTLISLSGFPTDSCEQPGMLWQSCVAHITDKVEGFTGPAPHVYYNVYAASAGALFFRRSLTEARQELVGVKRNLEIERRTYQGIFTAMTSNDTFVRFETLVRTLISSVKA